MPSTPRRQKQCKIFPGSNLKASAVEWISIRIKKTTVSRGDLQMRLGSKGCSERERLEGKTHLETPSIPQKATGDDDTWLRLCSSLVD